MYSPNFSDKRVRSRIRHAIGFTLGLLSTHKPKGISTRLLQKNYGTHQLGNYLREQLLVCTSERYNKDTGMCKSYLINQRGLDYLFENIFESKCENMSESLSENRIGILNSSCVVTYPSVALLKDTALEWANKTYKQELDTLDFNYEEKSHRLCNPIQNIQSDVRTELFKQKGLQFNYDIQCCAPTLLYQYSFMVPEATGEVLEAIEDYIANRERVREQIAQEATLKVGQVKKIINALFAGGMLTVYPGSQVFALVNDDVATMNFLKQHPYLTQLRNEIKTMWEPIKPTSPVEYYTTKTGKTRKRAFNARAKWNIYFQLERQVLNEIRSYLEHDEIKCQYFLEHDGFRTHKPIDTRDLALWIEAGTDNPANTRWSKGFQVVIEPK